MSQIWIIALTILSFWMVKYIWNIPALSPIAKIFITLHFLIWYVIPLLIASLFPYDQLADDVKLFSGVTIANFAMAASIELFGMFIVIAFTSYLRRKVGHDVIHINVEKKSFIVITILISVLLISYNLWIFGKFNYTEANDVQTYEYGKSDFVSAFVSALSPFGYAILIVRAIKPNSRIEYLVAQSALAILGILFMLQGSRIGIILPLIPLSIRLLEHNILSFRNLLIATVAAVGLYIVVLPLATMVGGQRGSGGIDANSVLSGDFLQYRGRNRDFVQLLFGKFDSYSASSAIINPALSRDSGPGVAGFAPYVGAIFVFLPRAIVPDRPVAGSMDGALTGTPSRVAAYALNADASASQNIGVMPLHVAIWHFGFVIGFIAFVLANVVGLQVMFRFLASSKLRYNVAGIYLAGPPSLVELISSPDVVIRKLVTVLGFMLLAEIIVFLSGGGLKRTVQAGEAIGGLRWG